jgi:tetratricopeptide (TPR) repeat protein
MSQSAPARRVRWVLLAAVVALAGVVAAGVWWSRRQPPPEPPMPPGIVDEEVRLVIEAARKDVLDSPRSSSAWGYLGMVLLANLFDKEAADCFEEAARLDPHEPRWPYALGVIARKRDPERAPALLRRAAEAAGTGSEEANDFWLELAEALLEQQHTEEAEEIFLGVRRREPRNLRAALGLARVARAAGDADKARALFEEAHASPYAKKTAAGGLAALARARGDQAAARRYEKEAATADEPPWPDPALRDVTVRMIVGRRGRERRISELEKQKRYAEAAELYLKQIEKEPSAKAYVGAALNLSRATRDYERALSLMRKAIELDPDGVQTNHVLALALLMRAQQREDESGAMPKDMLREAVEHAKKAVQAKPDHAHACWVWGQALLFLGRPAEAVAPLRQGVACLPDDFELQLALGEALLATKQAKEARAHLENARHLNPNAPRLKALIERADREAPPR